MFGFMGLEETCIFAIILLGATIQDGGIGVRREGSQVEVN